MIRLFDAHLHIIDHGFPLVANNGFTPDFFTYDDYRQRTRHYALAGGAVVSGSFQAFDQSYLVAALQTLGEGFVGVTQLSESVSDQTLQRLDRAGVRGLRFNLKRGGSEQVNKLDAMARRVHEVVGWHTELYVDARNLDALAKTILALPAVSIDHLGLSQAGFASLLKLVEQGVKVKATGFGRVDFDVKNAMRTLHAANPSALMFGTDLPSTRAKRPYHHSDVLMVLDAVDEDAATRILHTNAIDLYRPGSDHAKALN